MTLKEMKQKTLRLIEEINPESELLTDDPDIAAKINDVINQIQFELVRIKKIPTKMKNQIKNVTSEYRIYYNQYDPIIYTQVIDSHIELTVRYLIHPKKARYVNSTIWNKIIEASNNEEIKIL